jgi:hypothetical protein
MANATGLGLDTEDDSELARDVSALEQEALNKRLRRDGLYPADDTEGSASVGGNDAAGSASAAPSVMQRPDQPRARGSIAAHEVIDLSAPHGGLSVRSRRIQ